MSLGSEKAMEVGSRQFLAITLHNLILVAISPQGLLFKEQRVAGVQVSCCEGWERVRGNQLAHPRMETAHQGI